MIGTYVPGTSVLHRAPAGLKLVALVGCGALVIWLNAPWQLGVAAVLVAVGYLVAGLGLRVALRQLRPLWPILLVTAVLHVLLSGWWRALGVTGMIVVLVALAALVTLTTRTVAMVDTVVTVARPLRRFGVDPDRIGLVIAVGVRCVPVVVELAREVRDAQRARGLTSARAFAVPLVVRAIRRADDLGDALAARGADD